MGIFNFLETFFILSLAIMFVLVGLLIYHIRDRLNASEQRIDNLFDIATNLTNEINSMKIHQANSRYTTVYAGKNSGGTQPFNINPDSMAMPTLMQLISRPQNNGSNKIIVSDDDDEDDDTDSESDSDFVSDSDSESESESDNDESNINHTISIVDSAAAGEEIHVIKKEAEPTATAAESDSVSVVDIDEEVEDVEDDSKQSLAKELQPAASTSTSDGINIHKMSLGELRKLALEKNLISADASKMKKQELLNLLANA